MMAEMYHEEQSFVIVYIYIYCKFMIMINRNKKHQTVSNWDFMASFGDMQCLGS